MIQDSIELFCAYSQAHLYFNYVILFVDAE